MTTGVQWAWQGRQLEQSVDECTGPDREQGAPAPGSKQGSGRRPLERG